MLAGNSPERERDRTIIILSRTADKASSDPWPQLLQTVLNEEGYRTELMPPSRLLGLIKRLNVDKGIQALILDAVGGADVDETARLIRAARRTSPSLPIGVTLFFPHPSEYIRLFQAGASDVFLRNYDKQNLLTDLREGILRKS